MPKPTTKSAFPVGVSFSGETYFRLKEYHNKLAMVYLRTCGRTLSLSDIVETATKIGLSVMEETDLPDVIESIAKKEVTEGIEKRIKERKAQTIGDMDDREIERLLK